MRRLDLIIPFLAFQVVYLGVTFFALDKFVGSEFALLEQQRTEGDVARVQMAILEHEIALQTRVKDWAPWDDTYEFAKTGDRDFVHRNLLPETLENLNLDLMIFADRAGNVIWSHVAGRAELADLRIADLTNLTDGVERPESYEGVHGVFQLSDTALYIVAAHPILTSERQGPAEGTVIFGWELSSSGIERIRRPLAVEFDLKLVGSDPGDLWLVDKILESDLPLIKEGNSGRQYAYT